MGRSVFAVGLLYLVVFSSWGYVQSDEEGYISAELFNKGLDFFVNTLLIEQAESLLPFHLPDLEKNIKLPIIGDVHLGVMNMSFYSFHVTSSTAKIGETGVVISVANATASLSLNWEYSYRNSWLIPIEISDHGTATIQVEELEFGITIGLENERGSLKLSVLECGCSVGDLSITLEGGSSWLYQGFVDAFEDLIASAAEDTISDKVKDGIESFNPVLQSFPKEFAINSFAALNITFIGDPELSDSSLKLAINGLLSVKNDTMVSKSYYEYLQDKSCSGQTIMLKVSVKDRVLASASVVYFEAGKMRWIVDKVPDASLLNTSWWKFVIPQLYEQYPNDQMSLNVSVVSPPVIKFEESQVAATVPLDVVINVLDHGLIVPVADISVEISAAASPEISSNAVSGSIKLKKFTMSQKWSKVGSLHMNLIEPLISAALKSVILPIVNLKLSKGIPLPLLHGYGLQNTNIEYTDSSVVVCTDLAQMEKFSLSLIPYLY